MPSSGTFVAVTLALALVAPTVFAQSAADVATARDLFREGMELRTQGKLSEALGKLKAAHELYETPPSALELARTQIDLGKLAEGYETLMSIERIPNAKDSERSKLARTEAKDLADRTKARIPSLRIDVKGDPNTTVTFDGALVSPALFGIARKIDPGKHVVTCASKRIEVDVPEGQTVEVPCEPETQVLASIGGGVIQAPPLENRFSVLYKFLPPKANERWSLRARGGALLCQLPCERWIGEHSGIYLMRAPMPEDDEARRVYVADTLPATIGASVTARPFAGRGSSGAGALGSVLSVLGVLGVIGGPITLVVGLADLKDTSNTGRDTAIAGGIITGVSAAFLAIGLVLTGHNYPARIDYVVGP